MKNMKVVAVMPAYNAEKTLEKTVRDIPSGSVDEIILVDDCSRDKTVEVARSLGLKAIVHEKNTGYGGNQKTCYREALKCGADIVIMIHPDFQYDARLTPHLVGLIKGGICDIVLGNRIRTRRESLGGGMPAYKYFFNRILTMFENFWLGQNLGEWHTGLRAYSRRVLDTIPWEENVDGFGFDQEFLIQAAYFGFRMGDIPAPVRYFSEASSIDFWHSVGYGFRALWTLVRCQLHKMNLVSCRLFIPKEASGR